MYERLLDKNDVPTIDEMVSYCGDNGNLFTMLNNWLSGSFGTEQKVVFPYGNKYGWGIAHYIKKKLICNIFAENGSFTVMMRLTNAQFDKAYEEVHEETRYLIDHRYPCNNGGWIHDRITNQE